MVSAPPKSRGRPAGSRNKSSKNLREAFEALRFSLADEFVKLYRSDDLNTATRVRLLELAFAYTHPKLKEAEVSADDSEETESPASEVPTENLVVALSNNRK